MRHIIQGKNCGARRALRNGRCLLQNSNLTVMIPAMLHDAVKKGGQKFQSRPGNHPIRAALDNQRVR
jgi:hypothetical protein